MADKFEWTFPSVEHGEEKGKQLLHTDRQWPSQTPHVPLQSCSTRNIHLVQTGPLHLESHVKCFLCSEWQTHTTE